MINQSILEINFINHDISHSLQDKFPLLLALLLIGLLDQLIHVLGVELDLVDFAVQNNALIQNAHPLLLQFVVGERGDEVEDV